MCYCKAIDLLGAYGALTFDGVNHTADECVLLPELEN